MHSNDTTLSIPVGHGKFADVDARDYEFLRTFTWHGGGGYASSGIRKWGRMTTVKMHRLIALPDPGMVVDHIDGDKLNNKRNNLRVCTPIENSWNANPYHGTVSRYKGVVARVRTGDKPNKWTARISIDGTPTFISDHGDEVSAALAYDLAAIERRGKYARTNFLRTE